MPDVKEIDHIVVVFASVNGRTDWKAIAREDIPDWLRDPAIFERLLAGEQVINTADKHPMYYSTLEVDRPRPAGQHRRRMAAMRAANGVSSGGIILPS